MTQNLAAKFSRRQTIKSRRRRKNPGRRANAVKLVAVSKTHSIETVQTAIRAGRGNFGENKIQEAENKTPSSGAKTPNGI